MEVSKKSLQQFLSRLKEEKLVRASLPSCLLWPLLDLAKLLSASFPAPPPYPPFLSPHHLLLLPPLRLSRACRQSRFGTLLLQPTLQLLLQNHLFSIWSQREWMDGGSEVWFLFFLFFSSSVVRRVFNLVDHCYGSLKEEILQKSHFCCRLFISMDLHLLLSKDFHSIHVYNLDLLNKQYQKKSPYSRMNLQCL